MENVLFDFATILTHPLSENRDFPLPPINSMRFCQPQKPKHNLLATDPVEHLLISSSCLLGGPGCAFPSGGNVPVKTIFLLASALSHRQKGLEVQLLIVLAFFACKWQSFHSTSCDMKISIGLKHTLGSSPILRVWKAPCLSHWVYCGQTTESLSKQLSICFHGKRC